jgi:DNA-binding transcriptional regulator YiaG
MREASVAPPIEFRLHSDVPVRVLEEIRERYGFWIMEDGDEDDDEWIDVSTTPKYLAFRAAQTPGSWISGYRKAIGLTQSELGKRLGGVSPARVSDWEHDRRAVSKDFAKKLSKLFGVSAERFL